MGGGDDSEGNLTWGGKTAELRAAMVAIMAETIRAAEPVGTLTGRPNAAVLMLGSALGVGFVPPAEGYRPLAERFTPA